MTGLNAVEDVIIEIATIITDDDLNVIAEGPDLVIHTTDERLAGMDPVVVKMHAKSGLTEEVKASTITLEEATAQTLAFLKEHISEPRSVPLCGNSIGVDRRFLAIHMPEIEEFLHYRSIDVSTIKELARRWYPETMGGHIKKNLAHRALDDIRESIDELRYWRTQVFKPVANTSGDNATSDSDNDISNDSNNGAALDPDTDSN